MSSNIPKLLVTRFWAVPCSLRVFIVYGKWMEMGTGHLLGLSSCTLAIPGGHLDAVPC